MLNETVNYLGTSLILNREKQLKFNGVYRIFDKNNTLVNSLLASCIMAS